MGEMHLITGYAGEEHITSADQGSFNSSFFGTGEYVMQAGNQLAASITSNSNVRLLDGDILMQGRHGRIKPGQYVDVTISTGTAGMNRIDLIVCTYEKNTSTGVESTKIEVVKGTATTGTASDPTYTVGNILEGAVKSQMPLYRVRIQGVVLSTIQQMFTVIPTYAQLAEQYEAEFKEACETHLNSLNILDTLETIEANTQSNQLAGALGVKQLAASVSSVSKSAGSWISGITIASGSTSAVIRNALITASSIIDVYYSESSKEVVSDAVPTYTQTTGALTITFENAIASDVTIDQVKVVNP